MATGRCAPTFCLGLVDGNNVEVREGLELGDTIVSSSYEAFKEEAEITLVTEGEIK